jgi:hypothetical protein
MAQREQAKRLSAIFARTAEVLERSAVLADEHAERHAELHRRDLALEERRAAKRAHGDAERARLRAAAWEDLLHELGEKEDRAAERDRRADERDRIADERERAADERERIADDHEQAADEREAHGSGDQVVRLRNARQRSQEVLQRADETVRHARARMTHLATERQGEDEQPSAEG